MHNKNLSTNKKYGYYKYHIKKKKSKEIIVNLKKWII